MSVLSNEALQQLFTEARTCVSWQDRPVSNQTLQEIYNLMKFGPTSANSCPLRILFVTSVPEKAKLITAVAEGNVTKVKAAPVTAVLAFDTQFYEKMSLLFPSSPDMPEYFASNPVAAETTAFRNSSLQGAYLILAARALGLDCGPMSGFDNQKMDSLFFTGTQWKSNFICNLGYGERSKLRPRLPRLSFDQACQII